MASSCYILYHDITQSVYFQGNVWWVLVSLAKITSWIFSNCIYLIVFIKKKSMLWTTCNFFYFIIEILYFWEFQYLIASILNSKLSVLVVATPIDITIFTDHHRTFLATADVLHKHTFCAWTFKVWHLWWVCVFLIAQSCCSTLTLSPCV